jgi:hypothetical protein
MRKPSVDQAGTVFHNAWGKGEFGAQMCPQSRWLERRKQDIEKAYRELGFDGIYYDWVMTLPCTNKAHNEKLHLGTDGVIDLLAWTRRLVARRHADSPPSGSMPSIAFENCRPSRQHGGDLRCEKLMLMDGSIVSGQSIMSRARPLSDF